MMDHNKAKKAVKKSENRKKQSEAQAAMNLMGMAAAASSAGIDPEIQAAQVDMQPADGLVNPYHSMGAMQPMMYSPGNMLGGYNYPVMLNPEA